ncbi:troponin C-like [Myzus persicae]|uniref:troponin C-like n=1 Tax=Myzus persicae TaxID=13164 RepID=UPI000B9339C2|nr:troponin C-like [Myzus persicae]
MSEPEQQPSTSKPFRDDDDEEDDDDSLERPEAEPSKEDEDDVAVDGPTLPAELLAEAQSAFAMFSDGGGRMNVRHLYSALRAVGVDATDEDVITVVDEYDPTGRGHITGNQWTASVARRWVEDGARRRRFRAMLAAGDPTSTGQVTVDHVLDVLKKFDPKLLTPADAEEMVASMDFAGLGMVDYDEFMETMVRPTPLDVPTYQ